MAEIPRTIKVQLDVDAAQLEAAKDRQFWLTVRRALLNITKAIESRYGIDGK